jgi:DNA-binding transcriptional MerR regulator
MGDRHTTQQTYRIGTVARLTGISPDTLRVWERRYAVVEPGRSAGGGREYSGNDVERLQLIKQLVDHGDAIGSIAGLDTEALLARSMQAFSRSAAADKVPRRPCSLLVAGETLAPLLQAETEALEGIDLRAVAATLPDCLAQQPRRPVDVLVIEIPTVHAETARQVVGWLEDAGAQKALLVYRYAADDALQRLPAARVQTVRAPVTASVIRGLCLGMRPAAAIPGAAPGQARADLAVSPRRYSNQELAKLAQVSTAVKCECPKHLAELISDLVAFERYSAECESRNLKDAALHAYLHATASHARNLIEEALAHVVEVEGISLEV